MTSRQLRFVLAGLVLVTATLIGQYSENNSHAAAAFWAAFDVVLVVLAARGHRVALRFLIANAGFFGTLMLVFGAGTQMSIDGACFVTAAYLLWGLRRTPEPLTA